MANVSIKYKKKTRENRFEVIKTNPVKIIITIDEEKRILKFKKRIISRICEELKLNLDKLVDPEINSVKIIKDLGKTAYEID